MQDDVKSKLARSRCGLSSQCSDYVLQWSNVRRTARSHECTSRTLLICPFEAKTGHQTATMFGRGTPCGCPGGETNSLTKQGTHKGCPYRILRYDGSFCGWPRRELA